MVLEIVYMSLGPWSRFVIPWLIDHPLLLSGLFLVWAGILWAGKIQLRRNEIYLKQTTLALAQDLLSAGQRLEPTRIYEQVHDSWLLQLHRLAWFIPHRREIWPVRALPKNVQDRIGFSPAWVHQILIQNHLLAD